MQLDAYFARIGYSGPRAATLEVLRAIVKRHTQTIPFENLNPFAQLPVRLDLPSLERKLLHQQRGGYCYEQNLLLWEVLRRLDFDVVGLTARVSWNAPPDVALPRTHMPLHVKLSGESHIVDVAFGGMTPTGVLRLAPDIEQTTPHEPYRFLQDGDLFTMQAKVRGQWRPLYAFDLQPQLPVDYEPYNWYLSTYPQSRFVVNLIVARSAEDCRHALFNRELAVHPLQGESLRRTIESVDELRQVLIDIFLIDVPRAPQLDAALARLFQTP
ncbi:MAG TPA: arylamine N-acetyltransferase [Povalibacter sp.]|nr:arylamine N-acetyltransferase [Povalibacter sp.]